jgi:hypothetical protein
MNLNLTLNLNIGATPNAMTKTQGIVWRVDRRSI